jgi:Glutathione-dependent formaldehyde-activating enzyme
MSRRTYRQVVAGPPYSGHCLCGGVRFEVTEEPTGAGYCHCTRCQRRTGAAASPQARIVPGALRLLTGEVGSVRLGLFDPGHGIRPQWRTFVDYSCEWEPIPEDGLERYAEGKPR